MAEMVAEIYDALREAGVSEEKARAAASVMVQYRDEDWKRHVEVRFEKIEGTQRLHSWMLGYVIAVVTAIFLKMFLA